MHKDDRFAEANRWLQYASEDLQVGQLLLEKCPLAPRHACYFFQQAAEKSLKAALMIDGARIPFTHDLDTLRSLCSAGWGITDEAGDLAELTQWGVESRYPGEWNEPTKEDAARAALCAGTIYRAVVARFEKRQRNAE